MGKKLAIGTISTILSVGVIGGICYQDIPAFKTSVNSFFEDMSNINISIDKSQNNSVNENEVKPITPEEFNRAYDVELPSSFLGGVVYAKKLSNNNLIVSSSVSSTVLLYDVQSKTSIKSELSCPEWLYFKEVSNGDCYLSSSKVNSGLVLYSAENHSFTQVYDIGRNYSVYAELSNGDYLIYGYPSGSYSYILHMSKDGKLVSKNTLNSNGFSVLSPLNNGNCFVSNSSSSYAGIYLYNALDCTLTKIFDIGYNWLVCNTEGYSLVYPSTTSSSMYVYSHTDGSFAPLVESTAIYSCCKLPDNTILFGGNTSKSILYRYNPVDNTLSEVYTNLYCRKYISLSNGNVLVGADLAYYYLFDYSTGEVSDPGSLRGLPYQLSNGDVLFLGDSSYSGIKLYKVETNEVISLYSSNYYDKIIELENGDCLIGGGKTGSGLLYYDSTVCEVRQLLSLITVTSITTQYDGTYLIETSDDFDYEYNPETDTIKLVYTVEQ